MSQKKRIALITTWFPPNNGVAVNRMHAFAQYLSDEFDVTVFTLGDEEKDTKIDNYTIYYLPSYSALERFKHKPSDGWLRHKLISAFNITFAFLGISRLNKWKKACSKKLIEANAKNPFDLVISSYAPVEPHLIAINFKKTFPSIPWIADMRDEMSANPYVKSTEKKRLIKLEQEINSTANAILSVSEPILEDFRKIMQKITLFEEIRNGFNHDFVASENKVVTKNDTFTIGYFGSFYGEIMPTTFFKALENILSEKNLPIHIKFVGTHQNFTIPTSLNNKIELLPSMPYKDAIISMSKMDANLLIHPVNGRKGVYTGKLFDYISVQKSVIGIIDSTDVAAKLLNDFDCGYIANFNNIQEIEKCILTAFNDWENNQLHVASSENISTLHRKVEIKKLKKIIHQLIKE